MTQSQRDQPEPGRPGDGRAGAGRSGHGRTGAGRSGHGRTGAGRSGAARDEEPVGGLGEEAVKLLFALRGLAGDSAGDGPAGDGSTGPHYAGPHSAGPHSACSDPAGDEPAGPDPAGHDDDHADGDGHAWPGSAAGAAAASALRGAAASAHRIGEHLGAESDSCRYCPLCQAISLVRATPPEVRLHLAAAGTSLLRAAASLLDTPVPDDHSAAADPGASHAPAGPATSPEAATDAEHTAAEHADRHAGADEWEDD